MRSKHPRRIVLSRQSNEERVCECGQIMVDGKLIKDDGLFAIERTAEVSRLIESGVLLDQGFGIQSGWISTADGRIAKP
ncbi:hypothetical protein [Methanothrix soehngenii]|uniref:hypothetical protein n=1 Tax=Methanothrix soehngenii TaxID=2223 RepID=UPI002C7C2239|nr:hypothetical protein [Methanothrix soehngenii]HRD17375.1 hypothetical protein [Methanothrix soehngenii]